MFNDKIPAYRTEKIRIGVIDMRKCIRCNCDMIENYDVKVEGGAYGLKITKQGIFKDNLGKVHVAVCPECGYLEFYLADTKKIKELVYELKF